MCFIVWHVTGSLQKQKETGEWAHFGRAHALKTPLTRSLRSLARSRALLKGKPARGLPTDGRGRLSRLFFSDGGARKPLGIRLLFQTIDKIF